MDVDTLKARTAESLKFESVLRRARKSGRLPRLEEIDHLELADLTPWIGVVYPSESDRSLRIVRGGAGLLNILEPPFLGRDYLDIVDPAFQGEAFDSAFLMLTRPCGLWQLTPATVSDGKQRLVEYTGSPVFDADTGRGLVAILVRHQLDPDQKIVRIHHSSNWEWLDMRGQAVT
jgi:hypothetical protein